MKTILGWILAIVVSIIVFCVGIIFIPMETKTVEKIDLTYIFVDENGHEYDIFEPVHGSATDWSFLFDSEDGEISGLQKNNIQENNLEIPNKDYLSEITESGDNQVSTDKSLEDKIENLLGNDVKDTEIKDTEIKDTDEEDILKELKDVEAKMYANCKTPWNETIKHGESVIAYQQRKDVPNVCNAQRRTCNDGVLNGSYEQGSCKEDVEYKYTRVKVISYNEQKISDLVQTPKYAKNDGAEFDIDGKINPDSKSPQTSWNNAVKDGIYSESEVGMGKKNYYNCSSSWGEVIQHGQFTKAYESPIGFVDQPCKVELRLCLNGELNGRYSYKVCTPKDVTAQDYRGGNTDVTKPSQELLNEISKEDIEKRGIFRWISHWFK